MKSEQDCEMQNTDTKGLKERRHDNKASFTLNFLVSIYHIFS